MSLDDASGLTATYARARRIALIAGVVGAALCGLGYAMDRTQFLRSYLIGYLFWLGIPLGCVPILLLHHLVGGRWGYAIRRPVEAGALTVPLMALLFLPIAFGLETIYPWTNPSEVAHHPVVAAKKLFLNVPSFYYRTIGYFAFWTVVAFTMARLSKAQDRPESAPRATTWLGSISGPLMLLHVFMITFASVDWIMSLEPEWYSTIFGPMLMVGQVLTTLAFMLLVIAPRSGRGTRPDLTGPDNLNDIGNLLLAFVMLWAYMQFSQFLIIWSGNLLEEIPWYLRRMKGGWQWLGVALIIFQFVLPFLVLLHRINKRRVDRLAKLAGLIIVMNLLSTYWIIAPSFNPEGPKPHWLDLAAPLGVGGIWVAAFLWLLSLRAPVPGNAPPPELDHHEGLH